MGRFDALTQLDKKPQSPTPPPVVPAADPQIPDPLAENEIVSLLAKKQTSKLANQQNSLLVKKQTNKEVRKQTSQLADLQTSKEVNPQGSKLLKKFGSYLPPETIKALKRFAFDNDRKEYEVLKEAIDLYLEQQKHDPR
jgi:hypothetical protein